ncbi:MAG: hypothetical protein GEU90_14690 [Gemmatimonas sp.]|nr:hypothetical protein [Gemmatimonas sp.]
MIQEEHRRDLHYVWCSECFDSALAPPHSLRALVGSSSNPADIYRGLKAEVDSADKHGNNFTRIAGSLSVLAQKWYIANEIAEHDRDEILYMLMEPTPRLWTPLVYVIPRDAVATRLKPVHPSKRSGTGREFVMEDLRRDEFDVITL